MLAHKVLFMHDTTSCEHPWEVLPVLYFCRDSEELKRKSKSLLKKLWQRRNFRINVLLQLLSSLLLSLKSQTGLKAFGCPLYLFNSFLLKTGALACHQRLVCSSYCSGHWMGKNNHWVILSYTSTNSNKIEIRLTENKQFLKKAINQLYITNMCRTLHQII